MSAAGIHPVSSKEHMLKPTDIFVVAAHEYKLGIEHAKEAAKKAHVTPERMSYAIMINEYSDPRLIRIRSGNTLFTIAAMEGRVGYVRGYNGDTIENYINNMVECFDCARKMGFDYLMCHTTEDVVRALKLALRKSKHKGIKSHFDSAQKMFFISTGEERSK
jgi:hypothetical protein